MSAILALSFFLPLAAQSTPDEPGFKKHVQPYLAKHCVSCHNSKAKIANLDLQRFQSAASVLDEQEIWDKVLRKIRTGEMPPKGTPQPAPAHSQALLQWLQSAYATYDKSGHHDPGRVTARRLNRAEYNNTIRDLTGLDLRPADDFPPDDSGYGFDNIGDVLSLSPALMEKYLNAAVKITRAAIATPRTFKSTVDRFRVDRIKQSGPPGSMTLAHNFPIQGDYDIRFALAGRRASPEEEIFLAISIDNQPHKLLPIVTPQSRPRNFDITIRPTQGTHTLRAQLASTDGKPITTDQGILVEYIEIRGPQNPGPYIPPVSHQQILICGTWPANYDDACLDRIVSNFARRAFRRPLTSAESTRFTQIARRAKADGESPEQAIRYALQAVLVSPHFLFRIENDPPSKSPHPVSPYELASRLSYFLWSSMPDEPLLEAAANNTLASSIPQQVLRMIADPRFSAFIENFAGQWLELRNLDEVKPAPEKFPSFDNDLRVAMKRETQLFFESLIRDNGSLIDLLDANYTFLNERLARHYNIPNVSGPEFRKVTLNTPQRGGVLTHASVLTVSSYPNRTSPVIRGKFLLENFLNAPPPPPPPNVPSLEESAAGMTGTLRQQLEKHRANAVCASCHIRMDSLGFGLENYDAIGAWRDTDSGLPIDSSGALPGGRTFQSPAQLKAMLKAERNDFAQCLTEKMLTFALGRGLEKNDRTFIRQITARLAAADYKLQRLLMEIAASPAFQMRRRE